MSKNNPVSLAYKLRWLPLALGLVSLGCGFVYSVYVGMPYPDPTPEMYARWSRQVALADRWMLLSLAFALAGLVYLLAARALHKRKA